MIPNECIIIGGGKSILDAFKTPETGDLKHILASKFTIACNYAYKHFPITFLTFQDRDFYVPAHAKKYPDKNPDIYEELGKLPLIVGINDNGIDEFKLNNTIWLNKSYREVLTGVLALKLAEQFEEVKTIYLLGFDWTRRTGLPERDPKYNPNTDLQIHYYSKKEINHRGQGYIGYYENHNPNKNFDKLIKKDVKIFNVNPDSNIDSFEKISYNEFYNHISNNEVSQKKLQEIIRIKLSYNKN